MAEEQKKENMSSGKTTCACSADCVCSCGCGWAKGHLLFRVIIGLIILALVFWAGVKVGEFKTIVARDMWGYGGGYGHSMMFYRGGYDSGYGGGASVVPAGGSASGAAGAATSGPVTAPAAQ